MRLEREPLIEFPILLPVDFDTRGSDFKNFIRSLSTSKEPVVFELIGTRDEVFAQLAVSAVDQEHLQQQLHAFFPEVVAVPSQEKLETAWGQAGPVAAVVEFGLANESVRLLAETDHDVYVAMIGALAELGADECGVFQVIWQPVTERWSESLVRAVTDSSGKAFFVNAHELADAAKRKTALPLYAAIVRLAACSSDYDRTWEILRKLASGFRSFSDPAGNVLVPLHNDGYPYETHVEDFVRRQSRRPGMLLNADELVGFVHLPSRAVRSKKFLRQWEKSKAAPLPVIGAAGLLLGINEHAGQRREVRLTAEQRVRHMHVVGASGTGKSTLLFNMIRQDIESGQGVGVLDPHGDLIDQILGVIPPERIKDVVLVDPSDEDYSVGFNILSAHSDWEKNLLAADLVSVFRRLSTSWGDQMDRVLSSALLAFLESDRGGTLLDLRRFLVEPSFREKFLATVRDPEVIYYWRKGFALLAGNKSVGPVLTRLEAFLEPKPIRYMVAQRENRIDFGDVLDSGRIFLAKLSQGALGRNSHLLGSLFVAKFQQLAMSRQRQAASQRRDFWLYVDEFQDFITPSMAEMLVSTRKYRVGLVLAHQELRQVQRDADVGGALSNAYTRVCFRLGDSDARALAGGLSFFDASDLQNLETGRAVCRVERSDADFNLAVSMSLPIGADEAAKRRDEVVRASRERYARPRADIEAAIRTELGDFDATKPGNKLDPPPDNQPGDSSAPLTPLPQGPKAVVSEPPPAAVAHLPASEQSLAPIAPVSQPSAPVDKCVPVADINPKPTSEIDESHWGKGGPGHVGIQKQIKHAAEKLNFQVPPEVTAGSGQIDLVLTRGEVTFACEISFTSHVSDEVKNAIKCIRAGYAQIAMISRDKKKLARIEKAVVEAVDSVSAAKVGYYTPEEFIEFLHSIPAPPPPAPAVKILKGFKVTSDAPNVSAEEARRREAIGIKAITDVIKGKAKS